jgi:hypothetical protein
MGTDLLKCVGVVHLLEKFHKAFAEGSLEVTGTTATESVMLAHECHSDVMPRLMADLTRDSKGMRNAAPVSQHWERLRELHNKHIAIMRSSRLTMDKIPNLKQVCNSIGEIFASLDELNGSEKSRNLGPSQAYGHSAARTPSGSSGEAPILTTHKSPFINRSMNR